MTTSSKWMGLKNSAFALIMASASLVTVNNLALADSEAGLQAGSQASGEAGDQASHQSTSFSGTQNGAEASHESTSRAGTQNSTRASVEAGRPYPGPSNSPQSPRQSAAPFAVGQERQNLSKTSDAMPTPTEAPPKPTTPGAASLKAPKSKTVTYHWGRSTKRVATTTHSSP